MTRGRVLAFWCFLAFGSGAATADSFFYHEGAFTVFNVPGSTKGCSPYSPSETCTYAEGINNLGLIVGSYNNASGNHGFVYNQGTFTTIDAPGSTSGTSATGINDAGHIVGRSDSGGYLLANGSFTPLDVRTNSRIGNINNADEITGWFLTCAVALECSASFRYANGVETDFTYENTFGVDTYARGINNEGQIVGRFVTGVVHQYYTDAGGFLYNYNDGTFAAIRPPGAMPFSGGANGINDAGQIVGWYQTSNLRSHGFVFQNGAFTILDVPGAVNTTLTGINNAGDVVGYFTPAPEPGSAALIGFGITALGVAVARRRRFPERRFL